MTDILRPGEEKKFPTVKEMRAHALGMMSALSFDTLITYDEFATVLGLNPMRDHRARSAVLQAGRDLLKQHNKKIVNVKNDGYRIIKPNEHSAVSKRQQRSARRRLREALQTVTHVALDNLTPAEVASVMLEQARAAIQLAVSRRIVRVKNLPPRQELHLPSSTKLIEMMRQSKKPH